MDKYFEKIDQIPADDLLWNLPEQKQGAINIIGGNVQNFRTPTRVAEYLAAKYPIKTVNLVLPDSLKAKVPTLDNFVFLPSTEAGSLAGEGLAETMAAVDYNLIIGDLSKNAITGKAVASVCESSDRPMLITRDSVDLIAENGPDRLLMNDQLILMGSLAQLQKILRAVYYPKMLLLSQSLVQVAEVLHKFTLSYPAKIVTLHSGQILVAENGTVKAVPLEESDYSPIMIWNGELAAKIVAVNMFNPGRFIDSTATAIFHKM